MRSAANRTIDTCFPYERPDRALSRKEEPICCSSGETDPSRQKTWSVPSGSGARRISTGPSSLSWRWFSTEVVCAGLALYAVHWLYEICNAVIGHFAGYPLWSVSNESTTFILLIGVCWELSMMFSVAGMISFKMLPQDRTKRYFARNGKGGISCRLVGALEMALLFALFESFLAGTSNHSFIWVYPWWGVLPVFVTTYIPFFLASNYIPDMEPKKRKTLLITLWALVAVLLAVLIPLGII